MQVAKINGQNNQNFGHSFRVSICLKEADGVTKFINPAEDKNLYHRCRKKIISDLKINRRYKNKIKIF